MEKIRVSIDIDLIELVPGYIKNRNKDIADIRVLLMAEDFEGIRRLGHSMKGSGAGYGFDDITDIGGAIEIAAKAHDKEAILRQIDKLEWYINNIEIIYE